LNNKQYNSMTMNSLSQNYYSLLFLLNLILKRRQSGRGRGGRSVVVV